MADVGSPSGATKKQVIITDCGQLWTQQLTDQSQDSWKSMRLRFIFNSNVLLKSR
jgi:hypothetical protein